MIQLSRQIKASGWNMMDELPKIKSCSRCGESFLCGPAAGKAHCWCADLPRVMPLDFKQDCLCPACLRSEIESRTAARAAADRAGAAEGREGASDQ
jgi:hypothetical protein